VVGDLKGPNMLGFDARTGDLRWNHAGASDPKGIHDRLAVLADNVVYTASPHPEHRGHGATFRGAIVALDAQTGRIPLANLTRSRITAAWPAATPAPRCSRPPPSICQRDSVYGTLDQPYTERRR